MTPAAVAVTDTHTVEAAVATDMIMEADLPSRPATQSPRRDTPRPSSGYSQPSSGYSQPSSSYGGGGSAAGYGSGGYDVGGYDDGGFDLSVIIIPLLIILGLSLLFPTITSVAVSGRRKREAEYGKTTQT